MIEGMLDGKPLRTISGEIAVGISNATAQNIKEYTARNQKPQVPSWEHAGYFYNETMHALMDVGAPHGGCKFRLNIMAEELRKLMQHKDN
jgi:hypothetical protein